MLRKGHTHNTQSAMGYLPCTNVQQKLLKQKATSRRVQEATDLPDIQPQDGDALAVRQRLCMQAKPALSTIRHTEV